MIKTLIHITIPKLIHAGLLLLAIILLPIAAKIVNTGQSDTPAHADAAIVLGTGVWRGQPTPVFRERINHAVNLYHTGVVDALIFTGGIGWRDELAEAEVGRNYALAQGVPTEAIFIETSSHDTYANLKNGAVIVQQQSFESVLIVSDPYHLHRALLIANVLGINAEVSATPTTRYRSPRTQIPFLLAETTTLARYYVALLLGQPQSVAITVL